MEEGETVQKQRREVVGYGVKKLGTVPTRKSKVHALVKIT